MTVVHAPHSAEPLPSERQRIYSLQVLRFIAAFLVFIGHAQHELAESMGLSGSLWTFVPFDWGLGVDIFFVISGFVMYFLTADGFGVPGGSADFMRRRIIRIVPLYWLFSVLMLLALAFAARSGGAPLPSVLNILFSFLFLPGPQCADYCFPIFSLGWTLNYEMMFYALFALGLFFSRRAGLTFIFTAIVGLMGLSLLAPPSWTMLHFWGYPITGEFLAGIGLAALYRRRARISPLVSLAIIALAMTAAIAFYQYGIYNSMTRLVTGGIPAALIVGATIFGLEPRRLSPFGRALVVGGDASYALYLWHPFGLKIGGAAIAHLHLPITSSPALFFGLCAILVVAGAVMIHRFIERPVIALLNRRSAGHIGKHVQGDKKRTGRVPSL